MKRKSLCVAVMISAVMLGGCGNDQYAIEKRYWQVKKQSEKVFNNPHATPPNELEKVINGFNSLVQQFPKTKVAVESEFTIARLYLVTQEYEKARAQLRMIVNKYSKVAAVCSEAVFLIGNSFQLQDKWGLALEQYKKIMQEYPATLKGLDIPIYIAQYYKIKYQPEKMMEAFKFAIAHYTALANKYANTPLAFIVSKLSAQCSVAMKDWQGALATYRVMIQNYAMIKDNAGKRALEMSDCLMDMALIYYRELKDKSNAKVSLEALIKDYPKSKFVKAARAFLAELERK